MFATKNRYPDYAAVQLVWPDDKGRYPWVDGFNPKLVRQQPVLRDIYMERKLSKENQP
jgi:hypothetical protein